MKNVMKRFSFVGIGFGVMALTFAGVAAIDEPSRPGMPLVIKVWKDGGILDYLKPRNDGGSPVTDYLIEYREEGGARWKAKGTYKELRYPLQVREGATLQFRVRAVNAAGISEPSKIGVPVEFRDRL